MSNRANFAPGEAKENWAILRALSAEMGNSLPYDNLSQLRKVLIQLYPHFEQTDDVSLNEWTPLKTGKLLDKDFVNYVSDFYLTNPVARASSVMAQLSANAKVRNNSKVAAE